MSCSRSKTSHSRVARSLSKSEWLITFFEMFVTSPAKWGDLWAKSGSEWVYTPVWVPQLPMSIGTILLAVCVWDYLTRLAAKRETSIIGEAVE